MAALIILVILALAAVYGLFFVIFKIIALLCKKQGYKMPLIAAGVATVLVAILTGVAIYRLYQQVMTPFQPIVQTIQSQQTPLIGQRLYIDPTYGFSVTQYDGMVFSKWLDIASAHVLIGVDTNSFIRPTTADKTFAAFSIIHNTVPAETTAEQLMQALLPQLQNNNSEVELELQMPQPVELGEDHIGSYLAATIYSDKLPSSGLPVAMLIAVQDGQAYYFIGTSNQEDNVLWNTLTSFRFPL